MTYLLSEDGRRALRALVGKPILYAFDFDGTLAPVSSKRAAVKLPRSVYEWLKELAKRAPCAVISGRALEDITARMNGTVPHLIGNHGIESALASPSTLVEAERVCRAWLQDLATPHNQPLKDLGVEVEDKRYSLTVHYRGVMDPARARMSVLQHLQQLLPVPRLIIGKSTVNALPPGLGGKGAAAQNLMAHLRQTGLFYVGDDETDEDVFGLSEGLALGVRVGQQEHSQASYYLKHQGELEEVIRFLVHRIDRTPESFEGNGPRAAGER